MSIIYIKYFFIIQEWYWDGIIYTSLLKLFFQSSKIKAIHCPLFKPLEMRYCSIFPNRKDQKIITPVIITASRIPMGFVTTFVFFFPSGKQLKKAIIRKYRQQPSIRKRKGLFHVVCPVAVTLIFYCSVLFSHRLSKNKVPILSPGPVFCPVKLRH